MPTKQQVKAQKPSAYKSMALSKLGLSKPVNKSNKGALMRWSGEKWINLTAQLTDKKELPCGTKGKIQKEQNLPSVCRPKRKVSAKTPEIASSYSTAQIKKAIAIKKKKGKTIQWSKL